MTSDVITSVVAAVYSLDICDESLWLDERSGSSAVSTYACRWAPEDSKTKLPSARWNSDIPTGDLCTPSHKNFQPLFRRNDFRPIELEAGLRAYVQAVCDCVMIRCCLPLMSHRYPCSTSSLCDTRNSSGALTQSASTVQVPPPSYPCLVTTH